MLECSKEACECRSFVPGSGGPRSCAECNHGWVAHALKRLGRSLNERTMVVQTTSATVLELASLVLFGAHAIPIRLKILLDRLFILLSPNERKGLLQGFGWTEEDFIKAYISQDSDGKSLTQWTICSREEEDRIIPQFLKFPETRSVALRMMQEDASQRTTSDSSSLSSTSSQSSPLRTDLFHHHRTERAVSADARKRSRSSRSRPVSPRESQVVLPRKSKSLDPSPERSYASDTEGSEAGMELDLDSAGDVPEDLSTKGCVTPAKQKQFLDSVAFLNQQPGRAELLAQYNPMMELYEGKTGAFDRFKFNSGPTGSNGKKRVPCHACQKDFCDKGALKIHFSAVHLKEMHQCTRSGCTLLFSSRRSRNRHSANPNPKLHVAVPRKTETAESPRKELSYADILASWGNKGRAVTTPVSGGRKNRRRKNQPTKLLLDPSATNVTATMEPDRISSVMSEADGSEAHLSIVEDEGRESVGTEAEWRNYETPSSGIFPLDFSFSKAGDAIRELANLTEKVAKGNGGALAAAALSSLSSETSNAVTPNTSFSVSSLVQPESGRDSSVEQDESVDLSDEGVPAGSPQASRRKRKHAEALDFPKAKNVTYQLCKTQAGGSVEIPIDDDNPRKCVGCGKEFQNHFSVKTHYQNVHLKLMHACTVVGCNAAFPSKRSRDRHSSNYNLHRKLLSGTRSESSALHHSFESQHRMETTEEKSDVESPNASPGKSEAMSFPGAGFTSPFFSAPSLLPFAAPQLMNHLAQLQMNPFHPQSFTFAANLAALSAQSRASSTGFPQPHEDESSKQVKKDDTENNEIDSRSSDLIKA